MIEVDQTIVSPNKGNCMQAVIASLFELDLRQVPDFMMYDEGNWCRVMEYFIRAMHYEWLDYMRIEGDGDMEEVREMLLTEPTIDGYIYATVPSKTYEGRLHAVVINPQGLVVHDPNPNKAWLHINAIDTGELVGWERIKKDEE